MTQTLRRERKQKFADLLMKHDAHPRFISVNELAEILADASISEGEKKAEPLTAKDLQEVNAKVDYILATNDSSKAWAGREMIREDLLQYADWYHSTTGQAMPKRAQKTWWKALGDWKAEGLTIADLQEAYTARSKWRTVADPNELTKDAAAIHALPAAQEVYKPNREFGL